MTKPSKALTPAGAQLTERHEALLKLARRQGGVSTREVEYATGVTQKTCAARFDELIDMGLAFRAIGHGWGQASHSLRWFGTQQEADAFKAKPKTKGPGSIAAVRLSKKNGTVQLGKSTGLDPRYQVDSAQYQGGEFILDWKRLRGEA